MAYFAKFRLEKEIKILDLPNNATIDILSEPKDGFFITCLFAIEIATGLYGPKRYVFFINIREEYPFRPPKVMCITKIYHPNIDENGCVCIDIIRENWTSACGIQAIILSLNLLFYDFDGKNALHVEAGELFESNYAEFVRKVRECVHQS